MIDVFLIDDDLDDQEIFCMAIEEVERNIECKTANDGAEALEKLQTDTSLNPDYIFIDVNMPKMGGLECLRQIKMMNLAENAKVIMYSTSLDAELIETSRNLGADDFIVKPVSLTVLTERLTEVFTSKK
jgi:CheY-like chemotaxis protein